MRTVGVIQARMGSTRLPGKVLEDICGRSMLDRVVTRLARARGLDDIVVATTEALADDAVVAECERLDVDAFRGSEDDVLDRYHGAARSAGADVVVRVTADCPLLDPALVDEVVAARERAAADYASNTLRRTYPRGLDVEAFTAAALARAWREATGHERAHVTPFIYGHPDLFRLTGVTNDVDLSWHRWTVDTEADLTLVRAVYERVRDTATFSWHEVRYILEREPPLVELNRAVPQKRLEEG